MNKYLTPLSTKKVIFTQQKRRNANEYKTLVNILRKLKATAKGKIAKKIEGVIKQKKRIQQNQLYKTKLIISKE